MLMTSYSVITFSSASNHTMIYLHIKSHKMGYKVIFTTTLVNIRLLSTDYQKIKRIPDISLVYQIT